MIDAMGPNAKKLWSEIQRRKIKNVHVSWGPNAANMTPEERAGEILDSWERLDAHRADTVAIPRADLQQIYDALRKITKLGQATIKQWDAMHPSEAALRHEIFALAEFPGMFAGQALRNNPSNKEEIE